MPACLLRVAYDRPISYDNVDIRFFHERDLNHIQPRQNAVLEVFPSKERELVIQIIEDMKDE